MNRTNIFDRFFPNYGLLTWLYIAVTFDVYCKIECGFHSLRKWKCNCEWLCRMELRCVVAVIRHGDRTPKQKMKVEVRHPK